ncbi:hypothetical protein CYY_006317 [Polysphondylium violaceum]|uniref:Armadillo-like helical domain-containing protein n=1 Tax=Polysphondylium violaceum TaxID=133409 RepID=A0A8J4Q0C7_9MYCE|nr:hypothetical protein CYY_006317 [Polysphondylium violaceum]
MQHQSQAVHSFNISISSKSPPYNSSSTLPPPQSHPSPTISNSSSSSSESPGLNPYKNQSGYYLPISTTDKQEKQQQHQHKYNNNSNSFTNTVDTLNSLAATNSFAIECPKHKQEVDLRDYIKKNSNSDIYSTFLNLDYYNRYFNQNQKQQTQPSILSPSSISSPTSPSLDNNNNNSFCLCDLKTMLLSRSDFIQDIDTDSNLLQEYHRLKMLQEQQGPKHTEILLRKEDNVGGRKALKEKFVEIFEAFFNDEDPSSGDPKFWEQLFLLKVNIPFLERCIILSSEDRLLVLKSKLNNIFTQSCFWLKNSDPTRLSHIIEILSIMLKSIFRKKFNNFGFDVINILCGIDKADTVFPEFIKDSTQLLKTSDVNIKIGIINLFNIIATATDYMNQNTLLQFFMTVDISRTLLELLGDKELPKSSKMNIMTLLCYLSNYQKYETQNPYIKSLSNLDDIEKIKQLLDVITEGIKDHNKLFEEQFRQPNLGMAAKVGGYFSSWIYTPPVVHNCSFFETGSCLLILYELFYQNETFVKQLVGGGWSREKSCPEILSQFFTFCSYLASDTPKESKALYSKISLLILMLISESRELQDYFHDPKSTSYIFIYSKKSLFPDPKELEKHPLSFHVVDILSQFIKCNLKGKQSMDTHQMSVDCIQRVLSYKKKTQSRLPHKWADLWSSLFALLQVLPTIQDKSFLNQSIQVGVATVNIFNLFINYGDSFLPTPNDYDDLFYEIIRSGNVVDNFYIFIQQQPQNDPTGALLNSLLNIKSIVQHFSGKLQEWSSANPEVALTAPQVSKIIKDNYDTLRLKLQENLDQYNSYVENKEIALFRHYVKELVCDLKKQIVVTPNAPPSPPMK